jgi:hypothetical protein
MDPSVVVKANLPVQNHTPVQVIVANGNILWTQAVTMNCPYQIQGHQFKSDFRVLELAGYGLILGCDWIFEFSLVGINLKTREFTIEKGERICFKDETLPNAKFLVSHKKMNKLLKKGATRQWSMSRKYISMSSRTSLLHHCNNYLIASLMFL